MRTVTHGRRPPNIAYKRPLANPSHHTDLTFPRPRRPLAVSASGAGQRKACESSEVAEILNAARNGHISISRQRALVPNAEALSHRARVQCARARSSAKHCESSEVAEVLLDARSGHKSASRHPAPLQARKRTLTEHGDVPVRRSVQDRATRGNPHKAVLFTRQSCEHNEHNEPQKRTTAGFARMKGGDGQCSVLSHLYSNSFEHS